MKRYLRRIGKAGEKISISISNKMILPRISLFVSIFALILVVNSQRAEAYSFTYIEIMTHDSTVRTVDGNVIYEGGGDSDLGVYIPSMWCGNEAEIQWTHHFLPIPPSAWIDAAELIITATDVDLCEEDYVYNDELLGVLNKNSFSPWMSNWWCFYTGTSDTHFDVYGLISADGLLDIKVDIEWPYSVRIDKSALSVVYDPVPEPCSLLLLSSGLLGLAGFGIARRKKA